MNSENKELELKKETISVIGTGNYGVAIGRRLIQYGFRVAFGSRKGNCDYLKECLNISEEQNENESLFTLSSIGDAFAKADKFVFLAVSARDEIYEHVTNEFISSITDGRSTNKIIIELSNPTKTQLKNKISNAERLNALIKSKLKDSNQTSAKISVIKGFSLVNAYSMGMTDVGEAKGDVEIVPIAGDELNDKEKVIKLCNKIGFHATDVGGLKNALNIELSNVSTFKDWLYPSVISLLFFVFNFAWTFTFYYLFPKKPHTFLEFLSKFSLLGHANKVLGFTALQLLAFVYLGSVFASIYQLKNGTKYKRFPRYLDNWLRARKQFGLWAFYFATFHVIASLLVTNPSYMEGWFRPIYNKTGANSFGLTKMSLHGELNVLTGIIAYLIMVLVALSSVNSIANSLNWSEWRFVQSNLGLGCLAMALTHDLVMYLRIYLEKDEKNYSVTYLVTRVKLIGVYLPLLVLVLRFVFSCFPPLSNRIKNIRNGSIIKHDKICQA
jgi:predicted dinucleotide-binding enzyme/DMSO/TMAO reductase YedYZ heme-binding membrane subunit